MPRRRAPQQDAKTCPHCGTNKSADEFYRNKNGRLDSWCKECVKKDGKRYPRSQRNSWLKKAYGITLADYEAMLKAQGGCCAICHTTKPTGKFRWFAVDHCHATGMVRGLLCHHCNHMIGSARDEIQRLENGIAYLREWSETPGATKTRS